MPNLVKFLTTKAGQFCKKHDTLTILISIMAHHQHCKNFNVKFYRLFFVTVINFCHLQASTLERTFLNKIYLICSSKHYLIVISNKKWYRLWIYLNGPIKKRFLATCIYKIVGFNEILFKKCFLEPILPKLNFNRFQIFSLLR